MHSEIKKVFISYASKDLEEVKLLDLELRRRGVPLWRDRTDLPTGRTVESELEKAARAAAGFVFYLTRRAAASRWVREKELSYARKNAQRSPSFGIVPIFRGPAAAIVAQMQQLGKAAAPSRDPSFYNLAEFQGFPVDSERPLELELARAADKVLDSFMRTLTERAGSGAPLTIGLATRGGPDLALHSLDLLVDWSADYPPSAESASAMLEEDRKTRPPQPDFCKATLNRALASLWRAVRRHFPGVQLRIIPNCHLTMALAFGFLLRRNTGARIQVIDPHSGDVWGSPFPIGKPASEAWSVERRERAAAGRHIALAVNITLPPKTFRRDLSSFLDSSGLSVGSILNLEPKGGTGGDVLSGLPPDEPHRMALAAAWKLREERGRLDARDAHLFFCGPPGLAILLAQQLSNCGAVQTYEWLDSERVYVPTFRLKTS